MINQICNGKVQPYSFDDLPEEISLILDKFGKKLWSYIISIPRIKDTYGSVTDYYIELREKNSDIKVCPFCGLENLLPSCAAIGDDGRREAFDHYLNKGNYPFLEVNFLNLFPACHHCNSDYKDRKNIIYSDLSNEKRRTKVFYPFDQNLRQHKILVKIDNLDEFTFNISGSEEYREEVESWKSIYEIPRRYSDSLKDKHEVFYKIIKSLMKESGGNIIIAKRIYIATIGDLPLPDSELKIAFGNKVFEMLSHSTCNI